MKPTSRALLFYACLVSLPLFAQQPHQHGALTVRGDQHPEQISDNRTWLMELIAATSTPKDSAGMKYAAQPRALDKTVLADFRTSFDALTIAYNAGLSNGRYGTTADDIALRQQFFKDVEELLTTTIGKLENSMSAADWQATVKHVRANKARITFTDDAQAAADAQAEAGVTTSAVYHPGQAKLVRTQTTVTGAYAAGGYTTFTEIYSDGSYWHQIVHLYGTSTGQWTCTYDTYHGQWQPPGCPNPHHDFYTSNQINGQGYTNYYETTAWNPAQYVGISHEFDSPVGRNDGSETTQTSAAVICSVAGYIMPPSATTIFKLIKFGVTYEQWDYTMGATVGGSPTCNVHAACSNQKPYIVDIPYVILLQVPPFNNTTCAPAFTCLGVCVRAAPGYPWSCTDNQPRAAWCNRLWEGVPNPPQACTPHP